MSGVVPNINNLLSVSNIGATSPSGVNSTNTVLLSGQTFTGAAEQNNYSGVLVAVISDQAGTMFMEFSKDGTNWDSSVSFSVSAATNEVHRLVKASRYFRVRFTNTSASPQTYFRLSTYYGDFPQLTSSLNSTVQQDADAAVVRNVSEETTIAQGLFQGYSLVNKFGRNPDVDTGTVPEDIWQNSSTYTGFPTGAPEELQFFSSDAGDTGVVTFMYLPSNTATVYLQGTVTLNGVTPVNSGITAYRVHTAFYNNSNATTFNLGTITCRHRTTTANVFFVMPIGTSQTYSSAYTIPFGNTGLIKRLFCRVYNNTAGNVEGGLWVRSAGTSPRIRRPFSASNTDAFEEQTYGGIMLPALSDITIRITAASTTNLVVVAGYDLVLIRS